MNGSRELCMRIFPRQDPTVNNRPCKHHKQGFQLGKAGQPGCAFCICPRKSPSCLRAVSFLDQGWLRPPFSALLYPRRAGRRSVPYVPAGKLEAATAVSSHPSISTTGRKGCMPTAHTGERLNASGRPGTTTAGRPSGKTKKKGRGIRLCDRSIGRPEPSSVERGG
jgi:hypothetical protein